MNHIMFPYSIAVSHGIDVKLRVKRLTDTAKLPERAHDTDLGYDLFVDLGGETDLGPVLRVAESKLISTGIAIAMPAGWGSFIKDRSSVSSKHGIHVHAGVIDNGYHGEIKVLLYNSSDYNFRLQHNMKIAQLVPIMVPSFEITEVEDFNEVTSRGDRGFGSSGM